MTHSKPPSRFRIVERMPAIQNGVYDVERLDGS
jgi:hypothetical protein